MAPTGHTANVLGALACAVSDRLTEALADLSPGSESADATLSSLDQFLERPSIDLVSGVVGLSHSGTVRLIDRLERDGLVRRSPGADLRTTSVSLTAAGRQRARQLERSRLRLLEAVLEPLTSDEREQLAALAGRMLVGMMRGPGATRWLCRMCDLSACGRPEGHCPVEREARRRYA
jgi:DNA-binding MarR family transcriptional regulator